VTTARRPSSPRGRRLPSAGSLFTPGASPARQALERRSAAAVLWLYQRPRWVVPLLACGLLLAGLTVHGLIGVVALAGVALLLGWLAALSWPRLSANGRLLRAVAVAVVIAAAVARGVH
jgi:hypothetical protein